MNNHEHKKLFDDIHSSMEYEWNLLDVPGCLDNKSTAKLRLIYEQNKNYDNTMNLIDALIYQLRYKEAYSLALSIYKDNQLDYKLNRRLGVLCFKLLKFEDSVKYFEECWRINHDEYYLSYLIGIDYFYLKKYNYALASFKFILDFFKDDEMTCATLYWMICSNIKLGKDKNYILDLIKSHPLKINHHLGYYNFIKVFANEMTIDDAIKECHNEELSLTCLDYGLSLIDNKKYLNDLLHFKDYFGGFSFIAGYIDLV